MLHQEMSHISKGPFRGARVASFHCSRRFRPFKFDRIHRFGPLWAKRKLNPGWDSSFQECIPTNALK